MKNLIGLFVLLSLPAMGIITSPMGAGFDNTGSVSRTDEVDLRVKFTAAAAAGEVVVWDTAADDGATVDSTDSESSALGDSAACIAVATQAAGSIGKCRVFGKMSAQHSALGDNAVAGGPVYVSPDALGGKVTGITSPGGGDFKVGTALDASSATAELEIFVNLL